MAFYPVNLNIINRPCVVVGGGQVALRKVLSLLEGGAKVTVISPEVEPVLRELADSGKLIYHQRQFKKGDLEDAFLVFAATNDPGIQETIAAEARGQATLLNSVDDPQGCDFQVPASISRGNLLLTVSTGGASPALSKILREKLEVLFGPEYEQVVALMARVREVVVQRDGDSEKHKELFHRLLESELISLVRDQKWERVYSLLRHELPADTDVETLLEPVVAKKVSYES